MSEIKLGLHFMVPDLMYQFQIGCFRGTSVIERKSNAGHTHRHE